MTTETLPADTIKIEVYHPEPAVYFVRLDGTILERTWTGSAYALTSVTLDDDRRARIVCSAERLRREVVISLRDATHTGHCCEIVLSDPVVDLTRTERGTHPGRVASDLARDVAARVQARLPTARVTVRE